MEISCFVLWLFIELGVLVIVDIIAVLDLCSSSYFAFASDFLAFLVKLNLGFAIGTAILYWFCFLSYVFVISPYIPT